jgi:hypothetical protein
MTTRRLCPPAPGALEDYAAEFDGLFRSLAQRRGFRDYLQGLLLPRDRNKTLTGLAAAEPVVGAQHREVQRLQWFLSESSWDHQALNDQRVRLLRQDPATAPDERGVLVIDDTGDRLKGESPVHQRALPHQGEPSSAGGPIFIPRGGPRPWGSYQRWTAERRAIQPFRWSHDSVSPTRMG